MEFTGKNLLFIALSSFFVAMILGYNIINILKKRKMQQEEREDGPQSHLKKVGTPTMGGLITIATTVLVSIALLFLPIIKDKVQYIVVLAGTVLIGLIGFYDDYLKVEKKNTDGLSPKGKMVLLILVSTIVLAILYSVLKVSPTITLMFGGSVLLGIIFKVLLDVLVTISTVNSVNLTDGVDGLASTVGIIIMTMLTWYSIKVGNNTVAVLLATTIGAHIGFLLYNWNRAKIFMGDTGSFFLGAVIAFSACLLGLEIFLPLIAIIPVFEAISVIIQVLYFKKTQKRFFKMAPLHHHFEVSGWSEKKVVIIFSLITFIGCFIAKMLL